MGIRQAEKDDLNGISRIDKAAYGEYGGSEEYFGKKLDSFPEGVLVVEEEGKVTGVTVLEIIEKGLMPEDFSRIKLAKPIAIDVRRAIIIVFTTATNYSDKGSDSQLLLAAEKVAKRMDCVESWVPLTKDHPFKRNGVFEFWESNGYEKTGTIAWKPAPHENFECSLYKKKLV